MKTFTIGIALLIICFSAPAQEKAEIDSLLLVLKKDGNDWQKMDAYSQLALLYLDNRSENHLDKSKFFVGGLKKLAIEKNHFEGIADAHYFASRIKIHSFKYVEAFNLAGESLKTSQEINYKKGIGKAYQVQARAKFFLADYLESKELYKKALLIWEELEAKSRIISTLNELAWLYNKEGDFKKALFTQKKSLELSDPKNYPVSLIEAHINLGVIYKNTADFNLAMSHYMQAQKLLNKVPNDKLRAKLFYSLGILYKNLDDYDKALEKYYAALDINRRMGDQRQMVKRFLNIGDCLYYQGKYKKALAYMDSSLYQSFHLQDKQGIAYSKYVIGKCFAKQAKFSQAITYLSESLDIFLEIADANHVAVCHIFLAESYIKLKKYKLADSLLIASINQGRLINKPRYVRLGAERLAESYQAQGRFKLAYEAQELAETTQEEMYKSEALKNLTQMVSQESHKKEIDSLQNASYEEKLQLEFELKKGNNTQTLLFIVLIFTLLFLSMIYLFYRSKKEDNQKLASLNEEIRMQNIEIKSQRDNLKELLIDKDRFFSIISHDLRGPIQAFGRLSGFLKDMSEQKQYEELPEFADVLEESSQNLSQLLDNLLTWSMQQQGLISYQPEKINLLQIAEEVKALLRVPASEKQIEIEQSLDGNLWAWADRNSVLTICRNLLSNAIKFTPEGGKVLIHGSQLPDQVCIGFRDNGIGMTENQMQHLFDMPAQKRSLGTNGEKGTGLGLLLVKEFVKMNKGEIKLESSPGQGTCFGIALPIPAPEVSAQDSF